MIWLSSLLFVFLMATLAALLPDTPGEHPIVKKPHTGPLKKHTGPLPTSTTTGTPPPPTSTTGTPPPTSTTTGTGSGGHVPMGLLPGQKNTSGGVSNLLFGTNIANYAFSQFNAAAQASLKSVGVTVLRIPLADVSNNPLSDTALTQMVAGCKASGAAMLAILPHGNPAYCQHAVQFLGQNCLLYEYRNEPDLNPTASPTSYTQEWNALIPSLRKTNPQAAFIGPVLGVVANFQKWMVPFLQGAKAAGNLPDAVSFHDYPCTAHPTQAICQSKTGNIGNDAVKLQALIKQTIGINLPIAVTEWAPDASNNQVAYALQPSFANPWSIAALEGMAAAGVVLATQFQSNSSGGTALWNSVAGPGLQSEIQKYKAGATPPSGVTGTGGTTPSGGGTPLGNLPIVGPVFSFVFGGATFTPIGETSITLAPNADVTAMLTYLDEYMTVVNPFTEHMQSIPDDSFSIAGASLSFTDPFSWIEQFGTNLFYDTTAILFRSLFLLLGVVVLIKIIGEVIDFEALIERGASVAKTAISIAALA